MTSSSAARGAHVEGGTSAQRLTTLTIGVDIGGTKVAAGVVNDEGAIIAMTGATPQPTIRPGRLT